MGIQNATYFRVQIGQYLNLTSFVPNSVTSLPQCRRVRDRGCGQPLELAGAAQVPHRTTPASPHRDCPAIMTTLCCSSSYRVRGPQTLQQEWIIVWNHLNGHNIEHWQNFTYFVQFYFLRLKRVWKCSSYVILCRYLIVTRKGSTETNTTLWGKMKYFLSSQKMLLRARGTPSHPPPSAQSFHWQHWLWQVCNTSTTSSSTVFDLKG